MNEKIKAYLTAVAKAKGWGADDNSLMEMLEEAITVYSELKSSHRWYDVYFTVVAIQNATIGFNKYYTTGDLSWREMDLDWDYASVVEVEPYEVTVIKYRPCQN